MTSRILLAGFACYLAGCAASPPPSPAQQADAAACTATADATYNAQNYQALSRTSQNGLLYSPTPNHVFDADQSSALHNRDSQITNCERNGNVDTSAILPGPPPVTPHIIP